MSSHWREAVQLLNQERDELNKRDKIKNYSECLLSPTGKHEYMRNGYCKWCKEHFKGD